MSFLESTVDSVCGEVDGTCEALFLVSEATLACWVGDGTGAALLLVRDATLACGEVDGTGEALLLVRDAKLFPSSGVSLYFGGDKSLKNSSVMVQPGGISSSP